MSAGVALVLTRASRGYPLGRQAARLKDASRLPGAPRLLLRRSGLHARHHDPGRPHHLALMSASPSRRRRSLRRPTSVYGLARLPDRLMAFIPRKLESLPGLGGEIRLPHE